MYKKIVVITAHPDDMEIGCSGTLKRFQDEGSEIISIVTVKPSAEINSNRSKYIVEYELDNSYKLSGFELRIFDTDLHPDGRPNLLCDNRTMTELGYLIDSCDLAIIPNPNDFHQDHNNTFKLSWPLLQKRAREVWALDSWPYCYQYKENTANMYVGIDWNFKKSMLQCYSSYFDDTKINQVHTLSRMHGDKSGTKEAEAFTLMYKYVR
jgi:LmbE family N-acetylglucosaminyl deacetylase